MASTSPADPVGVDSFLTSDELDLIVDEAILRWSDSLVVDGNMLELLHEVTFQVVDLPGLMLGQATDSTVLIDPTAAGYGWFVDGMASEDSEFRGQVGEGELLATPSSDAFGRMDLLTVVMHEMGHVLGFEHLDGGDEGLMAATLDTGMRRVAADAHTSVEEGAPYETAPAPVTLEAFDEPENYDKTPGGQNLLVGAVRLPSGSVAPFLTDER